MDAAVDKLVGNQLAFDVYPNPVVEAATVAFTATEDGPTELSLYNIQGGLVQTLFTGDTSREALSV